MSNCQNDLINAPYSLMKQFLKPVCWKYIFFNISIITLDILIIYVNKTKIKCTSLWNYDIYFDNFESYLRLSLVKNKINIRMLKYIF